MSDYLKSLVVLDAYSQIEYKHKREIIKLAENVDTFEGFYKIAKDYAENKIEDFDSEIFKNAFTEKGYQKIKSSYDKKGITVITEEDSNYPTLLKETPFRPICLYCKGNVELLSRDNKFSIVGSRKTLPQILKTTEVFSKKLADSGVVIVTGVANGGDTAAVKGAYASGNLICVLACGFDFIFKERNREYIKKVAETCLIVTEYPPNVEAKPYHYPIRNRIIAGLSLGTLIASGSYKSGARHTATYALEYGREVFAFPYGLETTSGELCNKLIKDGAYLTTEVADISEVLEFNLKSNEEITLSDVERQVYLLIKEGVCLADDVMAKTGLKIYELIPVLTVLEIKNLIVKNGAGDYAAVKN